MPKAIAQITIRDENDITIGATSPVSPVRDQMWLDTSSTPSVLKRYNGTTWDVVNDVQVGGRNLAKYGCVTPYSTGGNTVVNNTNYIASGASIITRKAVSNEGPIIDRYVVYSAGKDYIMSFKLKTITGTVNSIHLYNGCGHTNGKIYIDGQYVGGLATDIAFPTDTNYHDIMVTFKGGSANRGDGSTINTTHTILQVMKSSPVEYSVEMKNFKIETGNRPTDWTPAPEDINSQIESITSIANGKNTVYYSTSPPAGVKTENDIWFDTDDGHKMYKYQNGAWVAAQFGGSAIAATSITADHIVGTTITAGKIATGAIISDKIFGLAVTTDKLDVNAVTAGKIATDAIEARHISATAITADKIQVGLITGDKLNAQDVWANTAFVNYFKATSIDATQITTGKISGDRIDISGLITFEALDTTLQPIFSVTSGKTYVNGGMIATNSIKANSIDLLSGMTVMGPDNKITFAISEDGGVTVNGLLSSGNFDEVNKTGYRLSTDGTAVLNQAVVRGRIELPNAGMTNDFEGSTVLNPVRMWAGASYELRNSAPFRVLQNGDLYATNAILSGILYGEVDSGMINIYKDEFTIADDTSVPIKEYVKINTESTMLNNNVIFGTLTDSRLRYINSDRTLNITNTTTVIENPNTRISFNNSNSWSSAIEIGSNLTGQDSVISIGFGTGTWSNTLVLSSNGSQGTTYGDISIRRKSLSEKALVTISGDISIRDSMKSTTHGIEMRSVTDEGWGFYAN